MRLRWVVGIGGIVEAGDDFGKRTEQVVAWIVDEIPSRRDEGGEIA